MSETGFPLSDAAVLQFLAPQLRDYGGKVELDENLRVLFAISSSDKNGHAIARTLLSSAAFAYQQGESDDDEWVLYYCDKKVAPDAAHWLADQDAIRRGLIRPTAPGHKLLFGELVSSEMPHRVAQKLAELHTAGTLSAGAISEPAAVRVLLDRLHVREPLFFSAFFTLLAHHLIDLKVLLDQIIPEDIHLENDIVRSGLSRDPFLQKRQDAATEIRRILIQFHVISAIDQQKSVLENPYAAYFELARSGTDITAQIDGNFVTIPTSVFLNAIHSIRRNLYHGVEFGTLNTQVPWITEEIAYSFRFIKQKLSLKRDLAPIDGLYIFERSTEG